MDLINEKYLFNVNLEELYHYNNVQRKILNRFEILILIGRVE